jgi:hypothetical protein
MMSTANGGGGDDASKAERAALALWALSASRPWRRLTWNPTDGELELLARWWRRESEQEAAIGTNAQQRVPVPFGAVALMALDADRGGGGARELGTGKPEDWTRDACLPELLSPRVPLRRWHERYGSYAALLFYGRRAKQLVLLGSVLMCDLRRAVMANQETADAEAGGLLIHLRQTTLAPMDAISERHTLATWHPRAFFHADIRLAPPESDFPGDAEGRKARAEALDAFRRQVADFASMCVRVAQLFLESPAPDESDGAAAAAAAAAEESNGIGGEDSAAEKDRRAAKRRVRTSAWRRAAEGARDTIAKEYASRIDFATREGRLVDLCNRKWLSYWIWWQNETARLDAYAAVLECIVRFSCETRWPYEEQVHVLMSRYYVHGLEILHYDADPAFYYSDFCDAWLDPRSRPPLTEDEAMLADDAEAKRLLRRYARGDYSRDGEDASSGEAPAPGSMLDEHATISQDAFLNNGSQQQQPEEDVNDKYGVPLSALRHSFSDRDLLNASRRALFRFAKRSHGGLKPPGALWLMQEDALRLSYLRDYEHELVSVRGPCDAAARICTYADVAMALGAIAVTETLKMRHVLVSLTTPGRSPLEALGKPGLQPRSECRDGYETDAEDMLDCGDDEDEEDAASVAAEAEQAVRTFRVAREEHEARVAAKMRRSGLLGSTDSLSVVANNNNNGGSQSSASEMVFHRHPYAMAKELCEHVMLTNRVAQYAQYLLGTEGRLDQGGSEVAKLWFRGGHFSVDVGGQRSGGWRFWSKGRGGPDLYALTQLQLYMERHGVGIEQQDDFPDEAFSRVPFRKKNNEETMLEQYRLDVPAEAVYERLSKFLAAVAAQDHDATNAPALPAPPRPQQPRNAPAGEDFSYVRKLYDGSSPLLPGSGGVAYLREARGISREHVPDSVVERSPYLRFHVGLPFVCPGRKTETRPALLHFAVDGQGRCRGVQRTYLADGFRKLGWDDPRGLARHAKQTVGHPTSEGAFWPVQRGDLAHHPVVYLAEGFETALGVASASRDLRVYHSAGKGGFKHFGLDLERPRDDASGRHSSPVLCLALDNDTAESRRPEAPLFAFPLPETARDAVSHLCARGWTVTWIRPAGGYKDFDDLRRAHGPAAVRLSMPWWQHLLGESPGGGGGAWPSKAEFERLAFPVRAPAPVVAVALADHQVEP